MEPTSRATACDQARQSRRIAPARPDPTVSNGDRGLALGSGCRLARPGQSAGLGSLLHWPMARTLVGVRRSELVSGATRRGKLGRPSDGHDPSRRLAESRVDRRHAATGQEQVVCRIRGRDEAGNGLFGSKSALNRHLAPAEQGGRRCGPSHRRPEIAHRGLTFQAARIAPRDFGQRQTVRATQVRSVEDSRSKYGNSAGVSTGSSSNRPARTRSTNAKNAGTRIGRTTQVSSITPNDRAKPNS